MHIPVAHKVELSWHLHCMGLWFPELWKLVSKQLRYVCIYFLCCLGLSHRHRLLSNCKQYMEFPMTSIARSTSLTSVTWLVPEHCKSVCSRYNDLIVLLTGFLFMTSVHKYIYRKRQNIVTSATQWTPTIPL